ncbi:uncharacterized protein BKA78DRAFT_40787 [Phyllosticta capitalensis]|uniref:uncharacterized protein n=1 Tax=Phyllosticta capitalensis TaxID=121624 RepID=UPI00312F0BCB
MSLFVRRYLEPPQLPLFRQESFLCLAASRRSGGEVHTCIYPLQISTHACCSPPTTQLRNGRTPHHPPPRCHFPASPSSSCPFCTSTHMAVCVLFMQGYWPRAGLAHGSINRVFQIQPAASLVNFDLEKGFDRRRGRVAGTRWTHGTQQAGRHLDALPQTSTENPLPTSVSFCPTLPSLLPLNSDREAQDGTSYFPYSHPRPPAPRHPSAERSPLRPLLRRSAAIRPPCSPGSIANAFRFLCTQCMRSAVL